MKNKLTEEEKDFFSKLKEPGFKEVNIAAQRALKNVPDVKTDGIEKLLDWLEEYLLIFKNNNK